MSQSFDEIRNALRVTCNIEEYSRLKDYEARRLYLYDAIMSFEEEDGDHQYASSVGSIVEAIMSYNREDTGVPVESRKPILLYINSPGGDLYEGFSLVNAIELSVTPVYTINIGKWCSMSFLIGIAGHKRLSFPSSVFLLHDGHSGAYGSVNKVQDRMKFEERYENEVIKQHVLKHSNMSIEVYDALTRVEYYMLPPDALKHGFIDEIITDIRDIL